jgi:hypothetical protein
MPSPATVISRTAATAAGPGDRGSPLRSAVSQRDGRPDVALRDVELAARGRPLRSVIVLIQVPAGSGATLPGRARLPAGP